MYTIFGIVSGVVILDHLPIFYGFLKSGLMFPLAYKKIKITDHVTACENVIINEQSQYFLFRREERSSICEIL